MASEEAAGFHEHPIVWDDAKVSRLWDYYARTLLSLDLYFSKRFGRRILRESGLPLNETLGVLDFGCGPGFIWDHLSQLKTDWQYTALDFSPGSVEQVRKKAAGDSRFKGAELVRALPSGLPSEHFDAVLLFEVVEHLADDHLRGTLTEVARLLKRGGVVVITTPNDEDLSMSQSFCPECGAVFHKWQHVRSWNTKTLAAYLQQYGLTVRMAKTLDFNTRGFTATAVLRRIERLARRIVKGPQHDPHLIAVFQKR